MDIANTAHGDLGELQQIGKPNLILSQEEENDFFTCWDSTYKS